MRYFLIFFIFCAHFIFSEENKEKFSSQKIDENPYAPLKTFSESLNLIEKYHPKETQRKELIRHAITGMLQKLDPHSQLMRSQQIKKLEDKYQNNKSKKPSIWWKILSEKFLYIRILDFTKLTFKEFKKILQIKKCQKNPQRKFCSILKNGVLIDLRGNAGGLIEEALLVADLFISEGILVRIIKKSQDQNQIFNSKDLGTIKDIPVFILIDRYSASASEILAASLQDHQRALILGRKSFGKGSIQTIFNLHSGDALKLTVGYYYSPKNHQIDGVGVSPDISWKHDQSINLKQYKNVVRNYRKSLGISLKEKLPASSFNGIQDEDLKKSLILLNN